MFFMFISFLFHICKNKPQNNPAFIPMLAQHKSKQRWPVLKRKIQNVIGRKSPPSEEHSLCKNSIYSFQTPPSTPNPLLTGSAPSLLQVVLNVSLTLSSQYILRFPLYEAMVEETSHLSYLTSQKSQHSYGSASNSDRGERTQRKMFPEQDCSQYWITPYRVHFVMLGKSVTWITAAL